MQFLVPICSLYLLILTTFVTLRLHYVVYEQDHCRRLVVDGREKNPRLHEHHQPAISHTPHNQSGETDVDFQDGYFAPLLASYRRASHLVRASPQLHRFRTGSVPVVVVFVDKAFLDAGWYDEHMLDITEGRCAQSCLVTPDITKIRSADAVLIHLNSIQSPQHLLQTLGGRDPTQPWIMFEPESPFKANVMYFNDYRNLNGIFNRTMHYRRDSDIRLLHGFVVRRGRDASLLPPTWRRPPQMPDQNPSNRTRKLAVAFVSNCHDQSGRLDYIRALKEHAPVDVYGTCGDLKCGHSLYTHHAYRADTEPCLRHAGRRYLFYLAFENALCQDYITEKLYNLLYYAMVPVVLGAADYTELLPPNSYINARDYEPSELAKRLLYLADHPQEYQKYLTWREWYQPSTVGGARILCNLCTRLYAPELYRHKVVTNFYDWYITGAQCNASGTVR